MNFGELLANPRRPEGDGVRVPALTARRKRRPGWRKGTVVAHDGECERTNVWCATPIGQGWVLAARAGRRSEESNHASGPTGVPVRRDRNDWTDRREARPAPARLQAFKSSAAGRR